MSDKITTGILAGSVDLSISILLRKTADNTLETGVAHGSATAYYYRQGAATSTAIGLSALSALNDAHADGGWKEIDGTNMPAHYRLDLPDAMIADGADWVDLTVKTANSQHSERFDLTSQSLAKSQAEPAATPAFPMSLAAMIAWITGGALHKEDQTNTTRSKYKADGSTVLSESATTDSAGTTTKGAWSDPA